MPGFRTPESILGLLRTRASVGKSWQQACAFSRQAPLPKAKLVTYAKDPFDVSVRIEEAHA